MNNKKIIVGITQGDGNGIGYEVIIKALADERMLEMCTPVIYGSSKLFAFYKKGIHNIGQINTNVISSINDIKPKVVNIINCLPENIYVEPGQPTPESAKSAMKALECAVRDAKNGKIDVIVTAPFNKRAMNAEGFRFTGHTEYLEEQFGVEDAVMLMVADRLKVAVATQHVPLRDVPGMLNQDMLVSKLRLMKASLEQDFGIYDPKIAVLGLNPHCGDGGLLGTEEQTIITPAVMTAQKEGIMAYGPYSPDGFFGLGNYNKFDAILAMYHDQGLTPFKALAFELGVNYTAGLPVVRTSPDHGTAYELAGRDEADPRSMISAIYTAIDVYHKRAEYKRLMDSKPVLKNKVEGFSEKGDVAE